MKKHAAIDFETYYDEDRSVTHLGTVAYTHHPKFKAYMVAIFSPEYQFVGDPLQANWEAIRQHDWVSHNAGFDIGVYKQLPRKSQIDNLPYPAFYPKNWHCTASMASYLGAPRDLAGASKHLIGKEISKDLRKWMKGKTLEQAILEGKDTELKEYALHDARLCWELWERHGFRWPEHERELSRLTYEKGLHGFRVDVDELKKGIQALGKKVYEIEGKIPWLSDGGDAKPTSIIALRKECAKAGIEPPLSTAEDNECCLEWEEKYSKIYPWVDLIRQWRKANKLLKQLKVLEKRVVNREYLSYSLKYFGAHTGRWSGDAGFNIQNMHKGDIMGVDIRKLIRARPGKKFIICDLAQIEPRILAWTCGDTDLLEAVREGYPIYEAHARTTMGWDGGSLKKEDPLQYTLAKNRVLGLGYGCGWEKFIQLAKNTSDTDSFLGIFGKPVSEKDEFEFVTSRGFIKDQPLVQKWIGLSREDKNVWVNSWLQVSDFRRTNPRILAFWKKLSDEMQAIAYRKSATGQSDWCMKLPSGRILTYRGVTSRNGLQAKKTMGGNYFHFWGGTLCENYVQATAREVFANGLLELESAGIDCIFHVHDEYICEVEHLVKPEEVIELVTRCPNWIKGLPIGAEAFESDHYTK